MSNKIELQGNNVDLQKILDMISTLPGESEEPIFEVYSSLEENSWDVISLVARGGRAAEIWSAGDKKTVKINGIVYEFQIIGFDHDNVSDSESYGRSKAGITFQMVNCYSQDYSMNDSHSNSPGWVKSDIRSNISAIKSLMPEELIKVMVSVNKLTSAGNKSTTIETTQDDLFLLSEVEIFGSTSYSVAGEGSQYEYYVAGNSRIKKKNNVSYGWFSRSPRADNSTSYCFVNFLGNADEDGAAYSRGIAFAFCV